MVGKKTISAISRNATEIGLVNGPFLVIRLVIVFSYGKDESIFVAKNVIAIILSQFLKFVMNLLNNEI